MFLPNVSIISFTELLPLCYNPIVNIFSRRLNGGQKMAKQKNIPKRSEVEKQYTWALEDIFATDELWEKALDECRTFPEKSKLSAAGLRKAQTCFTAISPSAMSLMLKSPALQNTSCENPMKTPATVTITVLRAGS